MESSRLLLQPLPLLMLLRVKGACSTWVRAHAAHRNHLQRPRDHRQPHRVPLCPGRKVAPHFLPYQWVEPDSPYHYYYHLLALSVLRFPLHVYVLQRDMAAAWGHVSEHLGRLAPGQLAAWLAFALLPGGCCPLQRGVTGGELRPLAIPPDVQTAVRGVRRPWDIPAGVLGCSLALHSLQACPSP